MSFLCKSSQSSQEQSSCESFLCDYSSNLWKKSYIIPCGNPLEVSKKILQEFLVGNLQNCCGFPESFLGIPSFFLQILQEFFEKSLDLVPGSKTKFLFSNKNYSLQTKLLNHLEKFVKCFLGKFINESAKIHRRHIDKVEFLAGITGEIQGCVFGVIKK